MCGQLRGHPANLAAAHRVGLTGERERTGARAPDLAGQKVEVDQGAHLVGAGARLVQPLAPHRKRGRRGGQLACSSPDLSGIDSTERRRLLRRHRQSGASNLVQAGAGGPGPCLVDQAFLEERRCHGQGQRHVRAGADGEMHVGSLRGWSPPRIDHGPRSPPLPARDLQAAEQDRVGVRRVAAPEENVAGLFQVVVAAGRSVSAEGALVGGDGRGHAEPRVGVHVCGSKQALAELVGHVVVLGQELAGQVEGDGTGAAFVDGRPDPPRHVLDRRRPADTAAAHHRLQKPIAGSHHLGQTLPLGTQAPSVGGMVGVAGNASDPAAVDVD